jgi:hypothetical protein
LAHFAVGIYFPQITISRFALGSPGNESAPHLTIPGKEGLIPMSDFIVRFHGVELSKEHAQRVQASIQKAVMAEVSASSLAGYTPNPDDPGNGGGSLVFLPHIWRGIIYMPAAANVREQIATANTPLAVVAQQRAE